MRTEKLEKPFCVVARAASYRFDRHWLATREEAEAHARDLIRDHAIRDELYVVRAVAVARKVDPPIEVVGVEP